MNQDAVDEAERAFRTAQRSLDRLRAAPDFEEAEDAWGQFLDALFRIWERLKAGCRGDGRSGAWIKAKLDQRKSDEMLWFIHVARNSLNHRIERPTAEESVHSTRTADGGELNSFVHKGKTIFMGGVSGLPFSIPAGFAVLGAAPTSHETKLQLVLCPVTGRDQQTGVEETVDIPRMHLGQVSNYFQNRHPITLGERILPYFRNMLDEAATL